MSLGHCEGLHAAVLAAGAASRFGSPKQRAPIDGRPLLATMVERAGAVADEVLVVLGAYAAELGPMLGSSGASVVINRGWSEGLASSIRAAIAHLPASCSGVMLILADQARVTAHDLGRLGAAWLGQPEAIVAARYGPVTGVPAIFPRCVFPDLNELRGDVGARRVIERHLSRLAVVPMPNAAFDLDTPADLVALSAVPPG